MQKRSWVLVTFVLILLISSVSAFSFSWFKDVFSLKITGKVTDNTVCGEYSYISPVSASASDQLGSNFGASKSIDGDTNTRWVGNSSLPYPKWISFDLGSKKCLTSFEIYFASQDVDFQSPVLMDVQISDDGQSWTTIASSWSADQPGAYNVKNFTEKRARYLRVNQLSGSKTYGAAAEVRIKSASLISSPSQSFQCVDSDSGKSYSVKGILNLSNSTSSAISEDSCLSSTQLTEFFCDNGNSSSETVSCQNGCQNGVCLESITEYEQQSESENSPETNQPSENQGRENYVEVESETLSLCGSYSLASPKSAVSSSQFNNYRAANSIDDDPNTHWFGDPSLNYPKWISFDLGARRCINAVELNIFLWDAPLDLEVQVSEDGRNWKTVKENFQITEGGSYYQVPFQEQIARYVRVYETAGKRNYGTLSEIKVNSAPYDEITTERIKLFEQNVIGSDIADKYYEIGGQKVYLEIDGRPVEAYF